MEEKKSPIKILVTGADGFIGSHLTEALVRQGYDVRAFVLYNSFGHWGWLDQSSQGVKDRLEIFSGDIRDPHGVKKAVQGCDVVLHLASLIAIPYSYHSPDTYVDTNIKGTLNVVQAAKDCDVKRIVCTSTSEVYGTARFVPITEEHPLQPQSPYSATKIGADSIAMSFFNSFDTPVTILRPFNTYGPRQSARAIIPTIITQIASGEKMIKLGSTHPTRDFSFIEDTVDGFIKAALTKDLEGQTINIGTGYEVSIGRLVDMISNVMDVKVNVFSDEERLRPQSSEVDRLLASNEKAKVLMDWQPKYSGESGLYEGLKKTVEWFSKPENLVQYKSNRYNI